MYYDPIECGARISHLRTDCGLTQIQAAEKLNVSVQHYRAVEARGPAFFRRRRRRMSDPTSVNPQHHSNAERKENLLTPIQIFSGLLNSPCHIFADGFVLNGRVESSCTLRQYCFTSGIAPRIWLCSFLFRFKADPRNISLILIEGIIRMERRIQGDSILVKIRS